MITHTDQRIRKLLRKGTPCKSIAKKIGRPDDRDRVHKVGCNCDNAPESFMDGWGYCFCCGAELDMTRTETQQ